MESQLQDIISKIRDEGVKTAQERARKIYEEAENKAAEMISKAKSEAAEIVRKAELEATRMRHAGEAALQQAGRDLMLSVEKELGVLFRKLIEQRISETLTPDAMTAIITGLVDKWQSTGSEKITVLVPQKDLSALETTLRSHFVKHLKEGLIIQPVRNVSAGFRIALGDSTAYFDITAGTLSDLLSAYLNPRLAELLRTTGDRK